MKRTTKKDTAKNKSMMTQLTFKLPDGTKYGNDPLLLNMAKDWLLSRDGADGRRPKKGRPSWRQPLQKLALEKGLPYAVSALWTEVKGLTSVATNPPSVADLELTYLPFKKAKKSSIGANSVILHGESKGWLLSQYCQHVSWVHETALGAVETDNQSNFAKALVHEETEKWFV